MRDPIPAGPHTPAQPGPGRRGVLASLGALAAALGASLCCVGPVLFVTFGVGAGLGSTFEPLRPVFTLAMVAGFGFAFWTVYGRKAQPATACAPGEACPVPRSGNGAKVLLWAAAGFALVLWSFSYWSTLFF